MSHNNFGEDLPYFIKPSQNLENELKKNAYNKIETELSLILEGEENVFVKMATFNSILKILYTFFIF